MAVTVPFFSRPRSEGWPHTHTHTPWTCFLHLSISVLCYSDCLFHGESCPRLDVVRLGRAWSSSRLRAPGIVPCTISFSRQLPCFLMCNKFGEDGTCSCGHMLAYIQADTRTHSHSRGACSSQYYVITLTVNTIGHVG